MSPRSALHRVLGRGEPAQGQLPVAAPAGRGAPQDFTDTAEQTVAGLAEVGNDLGMWFVSRVTDGVYTPLAASGGGASAAIGTQYDWNQTLCRNILPNGGTGGSAVSTDLTAEPSPAIRALAESYGSRAYAGAPILGSDGRLLGTLCGVSPEPLPGGRHGDVSHWHTLVRSHARTLGSGLETALDRLNQARIEDYGLALQSRDSITGLVDRQGWGLLLSREDERATRLAEPDGIVLVDIGQVRTARALRRAADAVREAVGTDAALARIGGRQFGLLGAGVRPEDTAALAARVDAALQAADCTAALGWAVRSGTGGLLDTWWRAEDALLRARSAAVAG